MLCRYYLLLLVWPHHLSGLSFPIGDLNFRCLWLSHSVQTLPLPSRGFYVNRESNLTLKAEFSLMKHQYYHAHGGFVTFLVTLCWKPLVRSAWLVGDPDMSTFISRSISTSRSISVRISIFYLFVYSKIFIQYLFIAWALSQVLGVKQWIRETNSLPSGSLPFSGEGRR